MTAEQPEKTIDPHRDKNSYRHADHQDFYKRRNNINFTRAYMEGELIFPEEAIEQEMQRCAPEMHWKEQEEEAVFSLLDYTDNAIIIYEPKIANIHEALQCHLIPFNYKEAFMLILPEQGRDLTPCFDAYQMIAGGTVPKESYVFTDKTYFEQNVGEEITAKALQRCRLHSTKNKPLKETAEVNQP